MRRFRASPFRHLHDFSAPSHREFSMRVAGRHYRDEWLPNFYPSRKVGDHFIRVSRTGKTQILTSLEDAQIGEVFMDDSLYRRLERTGHIITRDNAMSVFDELKTWQAFVHNGPQLHIVVLTKRCNLNCTYCHMNPEPTGASKTEFDLQPAVARQIIQFILESPNPNVTVEFQGGEAFLNFPGLKFFVEEMKRQNATVGKSVSYVIVSNLTVVTEEQLAFCHENGITISYTINGPKDIHDAYRITRGGGGSYDLVMKRFQEIQKKFPNLLSPAALCVITGENAKDLRRMIDFFEELGFLSIAILMLKNLGHAKRDHMRFDIHEFLTHYLDALDYIYEKNKALKDVHSERFLQVALGKIMHDTDAGYVDWANPVGDVNSVITYDYDGELLPADEARSLRHEFSLGNVMTTSYADFIQRRETFRTMNLSLRDRDPQCRECAYNPYCGVSPVLEYSRTGNAVPQPHQTNECFFVLGLLDWAFRKLAEDPLPLVRMLPGMDGHLMRLAATH
jgi:radical SAM protein with 4Fe4S-binding SPASM domain